MGEMRRLVERLNGVRQGHPVEETKTQKVWTKYSWFNPKLEVRTSPTEGRGVFARESIKKDERLIILGGYVIPTDEVSGISGLLQSYLIQIEERFLFGNKGPRAESSDFVNHSCDANVGFSGQIFLVAMRNIEPGEEIFLDYGLTISHESAAKPSERWTMKCLCKSKNCRGMLTEDDWKDPEFQKKYAGYFQPYIQAKIDKTNKKS